VLPLISWFRRFVKEVAKAVHVASQEGRHGRARSRRHNVAIAIVIGINGSGGVADPFFFGWDVRGRRCRNGMVSWSWGQARTAGLRPARLRHEPLRPSLEPFAACPKVNGARKTFPDGLRGPPRQFRPKAPYRRTCSQVRTPSSAARQIGQRFRTTPACSTIR
jgi:hypothetical protein